MADPDNLEAEFAIVVRSDLKGRGLGHILLAKMIAYLKGKGTRRMVGVVLRENVAMRDWRSPMGWRSTAPAPITDTFAFRRPCSCPAPAYRIITLLRAMKL
jgi:GNAT superfamily N-acetyltransferase